MVFTSELLSKYLNRFWKDFVEVLEENQHTLLILRLKFEDGEYKTLGNMQRSNKEDKDFI